MSSVQLNLAHLVRTSGSARVFRKRRPRAIRPVRPSRANELWYKAELLRLVKHLRALTRELLVPGLRSAYFAQFSSSPVGDAAPRHVTEAAFSKIAQRMGGIDQVAKRLASLAVEKNLRGVDERLAASIRRSVSVDVSAFLTKSGPIREAMDMALRANVELIQSIAPKYIERLSKAVEENFVQGVRWETLSAAIEEAGDVTESRAKLIARDQTSKMNGAFNEVRQTSLGIEEYTWQTSGDERVREEHAANDGQVFRWDDPPPETGHPGEDVNCRCVAVPHFDLDKMEQELAQ